MPTLRRTLFRTTRGFLDVVAALEPCSGDLKWYCVELCPGFFRTSNGEEVRIQVVQDVCEQIGESQISVPLSWERMKLLAGHLHSEDMALFIATKQGVPPPTWPLNVASARFEVTVQTADDRSLYVMTRDEKVAVRLQEIFTDCELVFGIAPNAGAPRIRG